MPRFSEEATISYRKTTNSESLVLELKPFYLADPYCPFSVEVVARQTN